MHGLKKKPKQQQKNPHSTWFFVCLFFAICHLESLTDDRQFSHSELVISILFNLFRGKNEETYKTDCSIGFTAGWYYSSDQQIKLFDS